MVIFREQLKIRFFCRESNAINAKIECKQKIGEKIKPLCDDEGNCGLGSESDKEPGTFVDIECDGVDDAESSSFSLSLALAYSESDSTRPMCHFSYHSFDPIKYGSGRFLYGSLGCSTTLQNEQSNDKF